MRPLGGNLQDKHNLSAWGVCEWHWVHFTQQVGTEGSYANRCLLSSRSHSSEEHTLIDARVDIYIHLASFVPTVVTDTCKERLMWWYCCFCLIAKISRNPETVLSIYDPCPVSSVHYEMTLSTVTSWEEGEAGCILFINTLTPYWPYWRTVVLTWWIDQSIMHYNKGEKTHPVCEWRLHIDTFSVQ